MSQPTPAPSTAPKSTGVPESTTAPDSSAAPESTTPPASTTAPESTGAPQPQPIVPRTPIWPRPDRNAAPAVLLAAAAAGVAAAVTVPWGAAGVGWLLTGSALTAVSVAVARRRIAGMAPDGTAGPARTALSSAGWAAVALGLLGLVAVRASEWLAVLCILGATVAGSLAVAGGRSVRGLLFGAVAVPVLALGALPWAARGAAAARRSGSGTGAPRVAGAVLAGVALLAVFTPLLAGADAAFAHLLAAVLPALDAATVFRWASTFVAFGLGTLGAGYLLSAPARADGSATQAGRLRRVEWALPVGLLVGLFAAFVVMRLATMFGGDEHVLRTTGLTYAEYARSGFWQLLLVTLLTLPVITVAGRYASTTTAADRIWLRALLGALGVLTLVIVASAMARMWAYQQAYGFTVLRVLVSAMELWLGGVFLLLLGSGRRLRAPWLPRAVLGSGLGALLALGLLNPDRFIAEHDVQRREHTGKIDLRYLSRLSADAVPALERLPEPERTCVLAPIAADLFGEPDGWRGWNAGRASARASTAVLASRPASTQPASTQPAARPGCDTG
jgi:hypothetical protein